MLVEMVEVRTVCGMRGDEDCAMVVFGLMEKPQVRGIEILGRKDDQMVLRITHTYLQTVELTDELCRIVRGVLAD